MAKWRNPSVAEQREAFRDHGVRFKEAKGATRRFRGNDPKSPWGNGLRAVTVHHTAGKNSLGYLLNSGNTSATGYPFANSLIQHGGYNGQTKDGLCVVLSWGAAWHSGTGGPWQGVAGKDSLHLVSHGIEIESLGTREDMTDAQLETVGRMLAAFVELGVPRRNIHRHADWTDGTAPVGGYPLPTVGRKIDTNKRWYPTEAWVDLSRVYRIDPPTPAPTPEPVPSVPVVSASRLAQAAVNRGTVKGVNVVEKALAKAGYGGQFTKTLNWDRATTVAYARWQASLGYRGKDADGIPGIASLKALAERTRLFTVEK